MKGFRKLEQARIDLLEGRGRPQAVIAALSEFQNPDGGFGQGLEPDFALPDSSAMATSIGLRILDGLEASSERDRMIQRAAGYLWDTFDEERGGWWAVPETVNVYPHAPWWDWNLETGRTVIDNHWGNPNAELAGYLWLYSDDPRREALVDRAISHFMESTEYASEHEVFCYVRFCETIGQERAGVLWDRVAEVAKTGVIYNPEQWSGYVPKPLDYLRYATSNWLGFDSEGIRVNVNWLKQQLERQDYIDVNWDWGRDPENWQEARAQWQGVLTLEAKELILRYGDADA